MFSVATANIQSLPRMPLEFVREDLETVEGVLIENVRLAGLQEIRHEEEKGAVHDLFKDGYTACQLGTAEPILFQCLNSHWSVESSGKAILMPGQVAVAPTQYLTWVKLVDKTGRKAVFNNTHYVSKAWGNHDLPKTQVWLRRQMWNGANEKHLKYIQRWAANGYAVIGVGDYNRMDYPVVGERIVKPTRSVHYWVHGGIDYIWGINSKETHWEFKTKGKVEQHGDHPVHYVVLNAGKP